MLTAQPSTQSLDFTQENNNDPTYIANQITEFDKAKTRLTILLAYNNPWTVAFLRALPDKYHASVTLITNEQGRTHEYSWSSLRPIAEQLFHDHTSAAYKVKKILEKIEQKTLGSSNELDKTWHLFMQRMAYDFWWTVGNPEDVVLAAEYLLKCTQGTAKRAKVIDIELPLERPYNKFDLIVALLKKLSSDPALARGFVKAASLDTIFSCSVQDKFGREFLWDTIGRIKVLSSDTFELPPESSALAYSLKKELRFTVSRKALYTLSLAGLRRVADALDPPLLQKAVQDSSLQKEDSSAHGAGPVSESSALFSS